MDYPYPTTSLPAWPIKAACDAMLAAPSPLIGLKRVAGMVYNDSLTNPNPPHPGPPSEFCFDIDWEFVQCADGTGSCGVDDAGMAWDYQACTEVPLLVSTNNITDVFPTLNWDLQSLTDYCQGKWGVAPDFNWLRTHFGGSAHNPAQAFLEQGSRIIFSNGLLDPYHGNGFLQSLSPSMPAIVLSDGAHHLDLRARNPLDPQSVTAARDQELKYLRQWVQEGRHMDRTNAKGKGEEQQVHRKIVRDVVTV